MVRQTLCLKMADKYHQHFRGGIVGKWQKFRPFSNNLLRLFENGRKQTINHLVGILLENGRNFCRFLTTTTSCLKTAENKPSTILWGLCWKTAEISAVFQQLVFGRFPTTQNVSAVFQQRGFGRFPTIFFGRFPHPRLTYPNSYKYKNVCLYTCFDSPEFGKSCFLRPLVNSFVMKFTTVTTYAVCRSRPEKRTTSSKSGTWGQRTSAIAGS